MQSERDGIADRLLDLEAQLDIAKKQLSKAQQSKPNFSGLGSKFEEVLRIAESQAEKMITDAHAESEQIASEAAAEAQAVLDESNAKAAEINRRAYEVSQESESLHTRVQQYVEQQRRDALEKAHNLVEAARLQAEAVTRESEEFSERLFGRALTRLEQMRGGLRAGVRQPSEGRPHHRRGHRGARRATASPRLSVGTAIPLMIGRSHRAVD